MKMSWAAFCALPAGDALGLRVVDAWLEDVEPRVGLLRSRDSVEPYNIIHYTVLPSAMVTSPTAPHEEAMPANQEPAAQAATVGLHTLGTYNQDLYT